MNFFKTQFAANYRFSERMPGKLGIHGNAIFLSTLMHAGILMICKCIIEKIFKQRLPNIYGSIAFLFSYVDFLLLWIYFNDKRTANVLAEFDKRPVKEKTVWKIVSVGGAFFLILLTWYIDKML